MRKIFGFVAIAIVLGFAGFVSQANAADGKALFQSNCAACHGANATGGVGPNIVGKTAEDVTEAINKVPMMAGLKGSITKADADAIGSYLLSLSGGKNEENEKGDKKESSSNKMSGMPMSISGHSFKKVLKTRKAAIALGKKLFSDISLGTNGRSCNSCHTHLGRSLKKGPMGAMNFINRKPYPHYFMMAKRVLSLDQAINFCVKMALKGKPLPWNGAKLTAINAYISSVHK